MFLNNPFAGAFGLDIGDLSMKLVQLKYESRPLHRSYFKVLEQRSVLLPPGLIVNGEIQQPELVRRKLLHVLGRDGTSKPIHSTWVVANLPEPKTFLKLIVVAESAKELADDEVLYQARKHLPFEVDETYIDWQVVHADETNGTTDVLLGAVPKVTSDAYTYLLESTGLNVLALEIEGVAIARALITRGKAYTGEARAILDLGATRSSLSIFDHDSIQLSTNFSFSGGLLTTAISQALKIAYEEAEKLKIKNGLTFDSARPKYLTSLTPIFDVLIEDIKKTFAFYKERFSESNPITHITVCGGQAHLKNIAAALSAKLKITASLGDAWKNILPTPASSELRLRGLTMVSALGLAMRAAEQPLPPHL